MSSSPKTASLVEGRPFYMAEVGRGVPVDAVFA